METAPIRHSPAGREQHQHQRKEAQRLEAGVFPLDFEGAAWGEEEISLRSPRRFPFWLRFSP